MAAVTTEVATPLKVGQRRRLHGLQQPADARTMFQHTALSAHLARSVASRAWQERPLIVLTADLPCTAEQAASARLGRSRSQHGGSTRGTVRRCWAQQTDGQVKRKVVSPELDISRAAAASAEWTLATEPWEQQ